MNPPLEVGQGYTWKNSERIYWVTKVESENYASLSWEYFDDHPPGTCENFRMDKASMKDGKQGMRLVVEAPREAIEV